MVARRGVSRGGIRGRIVSLLLEIWGEGRGEWDGEGEADLGRGRAWRGIRRGKWLEEEGLLYGIWWYRFLMGVSFDLFSPSHLSFFLGSLERASIGAWIWKDTPAVYDRRASATAFPREPIKGHLSVGFMVLC